MYIAALNYIYADQKSVNRVFARRKMRYGYRRVSLSGSTARFGLSAAHDCIMWRVHDNITDSSKRRLQEFVFGIMGRDVARSSSFCCEMRRVVGEYVADNIW